MHVMHLCVINITFIMPKDSTMYISKTVDGISDSSSISKLFADKYRELYTCVSYNEGDMQHIIQIKSNQIKLFYSAPKSWPESWPT